MARLCETPFYKRRLDANSNCSKYLLPIGIFLLHLVAIMRANERPSGPQIQMGRREGEKRCSIIFARNRTVCGAQMQYLRNFSGKSVLHLVFLTILYMIISQNACFCDDLHTAFWGIPTTTTSRFSVAPKLAIIAPLSGEGENWPYILHSTHPGRSTRALDPFPSSSILRCTFWSRREVLHIVNAASGGLVWL